MLKRILDWRATPYILIPTVILIEVIVGCWLWNTSGYLGKAVFVVMVPCLTTLLSMTLHFDDDDDE